MWHFRLHFVNISFIDQRLKEMKQMQRDPLASNKARKAEKKADEKSGIINILPVKIDVGGGFKKGGFKNAFAVEDESEKKETFGTGKEGGGQGREGAGLRVRKIASGTGLVVEEGESDTEDEGYEVYDPSRPTGCPEGCAGR